jgi:hypothetical protein
VIKPSSHRWHTRLGVLLAGVLLVAGSCGGGGSKGSSAGQLLIGLFKIDAGSCSSAGVSSGSWFRMVQPGGKPGAGPYVGNGDSPCGDKTWSPLHPGSDGGFRTTDFQPVPDPAFDSSGNGTASRITQPTKWFAVNFALATNPKDPQTGTGTTKPSITVSGNQLGGDVRAFAAAWNNQNFNQGAPKPDGSRPGNTTGPTGTYDSSTHHYVLDWTSQIVGGPFNNFTGTWHLEGTFQAGT